MKIGTPSWWSPPHPPAGSNVPRPATTAPVDINSSKTSPLTPAGRAISRWSTSPPVKAHSWRRWPPSPSPLSIRSLGPAMNPSSDIDISRTVAHMASPSWTVSPHFLRPVARENSSGPGRSGRGGEPEACEFLGHPRPDYLQRRGWAEHHLQLGDASVLVEGELVDA